MKKKAITKTKEKNLKSNNKNSDNERLEKLRQLDKIERNFQKEKLFSVGLY